MRTLKQLESSLTPLGFKLEVSTTWRAKTTPIKGSLLVDRTYREYKKVDILKNNCPVCPAAILGFNSTVAQLCEWVQENLIGGN